MARRFSMLIIAATFFVHASSFAQAPLFMTATLGGGLLSPQSSTLKGDIYSAYDFPLFNTSYSLYGKIRAKFASLPFSLIGSISYNSLFGEGTIPMTTAGGFVNTLYTNSLSLFAVGVGVEYSFLPTSVLNPYALLAGTINFIGGKSKHENNVVPEYKLNATKRIGLDFGIGTSLDAPFLPAVLDLEVKYRFANLLGKHFDGGGYSLPGFGGIPQTPTYNLNDLANPNDPQDHNRSINYLTVTLGVSITIL